MAGLINRSNPDASEQDFCPARNLPFTAPNSRNPMKSLKIRYFFDTVAPNG